MVYGTKYRITPAVRLPYTFDGYYTEPDGKGEKLTDKDGNCIEKFAFVDDICAYPYFEVVKDDKTAIFGFSKEGTYCKLVLWDGISMLKPLCDDLNVTIE